MPFCTGFCKDPEAALCNAQIQTLDNWEEKEKTLRIAGCQCLNGFIRADDHPWSECKPDFKCDRMGSKFI
jgi:hypothetical protein